MSPERNQWKKTIKFQINEHTGNCEQGWVKGERMFHNYCSVGLLNRNFGNEYETAGRNNNYVAPR